MNTQYWTGDNILSTLDYNDRNTWTTNMQSTSNSMHGAGQIFTPQRTQWGHRHFLCADLFQHNTRSIEHCGLTTVCCIDYHLFVQQLHRSQIEAIAAMATHALKLEDNLSAVDRLPAIGLDRLVPGQNEKPRTDSLFSTPLYQYIWVIPIERATSADLVKGKRKCPVLAIALLTRVRLVTRSAFTVSCHFRDCKSLLVTCLAEQICCTFFLQFRLSCRLKVI